MVRLVRLWPGTVSGALRAGIRTDGGDDGAGATLDVDWSTLYISTDNKLTTVPAGPPTPAGGSRPVDSTENPAILRPYLATYGGVDRSGLRNDAGDAGLGMSVVPDWETVVIGYDRTIKILGPGALCRFFDQNCYSNHFNSVESLSTYKVLTSGSPQNLYFPVPTVPPAWIPPIGPDLSKGSNVYSEIAAGYTGIYDIGLQSFYIWVSGDGGGWEIPCDVTIALNVNGSALLSSTRTVISRPDPSSYGYTPYPNSVYTGTEYTDNQYADGVSLTAGDIITVTVEWDPSGASDPGFFIGTHLGIYGVG